MYKSKLYNPINLMTPWKINYRLHDKYLIVDGKQYLLGGRNTNDLFLGEYKDKEDQYWLATTAGKITQRLHHFKPIRKGRFLC